MHGWRQIGFGLCVAVTLWGCSLKKDVDVEVWVSGAPSRVENFEGGLANNVFSLEGCVGNTDLPLEHLRIVALVDCLAMMSDDAGGCIKDDSEKSGPVDVSDVKLSSLFVAGSIVVEHKRSLISVETIIPGKDAKKTVRDMDSSLSDKIKIKYKDENLVVVRTSTGSSTDDDDFHVYVKDGLTLREFLDLLNENGLSVKICAEKLEVSGRGSVGFVKMLKDDSDEGEKHAEKIVQKSFVEKGAKVDLTSYVTIDVSRLYAK
jgi:hypothetical protein